MTTPWNTFLRQQGAQINHDRIDFGETGIEPSITTVVPLIHIGLIQSAGPDSATFLHSLFSNDVTHLSSDAIQWNSFNSAKGRMLANFLLWQTEEGHHFALSADLVPTILKKLSMYVLRSKVKLTDISNETVLIGLCGPKAATMLAQLNLTPPAPMHQRVENTTRLLSINETTMILAVSPKEAPSLYTALVTAGAKQAGSSAWNYAMIQAGLPWITAATQEEFVPQMINFDLIGGIHFKKGCYPGQEIVARSHYLGKLKRRLYHISGTASAIPITGTEIYTSHLDNQVAGKIVNAVETAPGHFEALAVIYHSSTHTGKLHLGSPEGTLLKILKLPYALPDEK